MSIVQRSILQKSFLKIFQTAAFHFQYGMPSREDFLEGGRGHVVPLFPEIATFRSDYEDEIEYEYNFRISIQ